MPHSRAVPSCGISGPLKTVEELLAWHSPQDNPPQHAPLACDPTDPPDRPKLLVCHDYAGGYIEHSWPEMLQRCGGDMRSAYRLSHWRCIDTFVYFSHHLVTLPPTGWVKAAHLHGTKVLGTFITEWDAGKAVCSQLFASEAAAEQCAHQLAALAAWHGFEGWLINLENELPLETLPHLLTFLRCLTALLHEQHPAKVCIWYDAVTVEGKLEWQDTLNHLNAAFFDACDGLFINYCWKEDTPASVAITAGERCGHVYMGVDVFGRGTPWGGGLGSGDAVHAAQTAGWVSECGDPDTFEQRQENFWSSIASAVQYRRPCPVSTSFLSTFCQGCGTAKFEEGRCVSDEPWYDIGSMSQQPLCHSLQLEDDIGELSAALSMETAFQGGSSVHITGRLNGEGALHEQLFETRMQLQAEGDLLLSYTCALDGSTLGISLTLDLEATGSGGNSVPMQHVFTNDSGISPGSRQAHRPAAIWHHTRDRSGGLREAADRDWETRQYVLPQHLDCYITSIGIMCHTPMGTGNPQYPASLSAYLGMISEPDAICIAWGQTNPKPLQMQEYADMMPAACSVLRGQ